MNGGIDMNCNAKNEATSKKPNFVFILIDDLGWSHVGYHSQKYATPNIDKLAGEGAKLEHYYALPLCTPSRAALLTGRYPIRYGLQTGVVRPWGKIGLSLDEKTLAQGLKEAGYKTALFGKWHLGHFTREYLPTNRGFDRQYGLYNGMIDYFKHLRNGGHDWHRDDQPCYEEGYSTELIAKEAVGFLENEVQDEPFFMYVPFNAVHAPLQAPEYWLNQVGDDVPEGDKVIAAMLLSLDDAVGKIVDALDRKGLRDDTLIFFVSDNGGEIYKSNEPLRDHKNTVYQGGVRVVAFANWPGKIKPGTVIDEPMHIVDMYPTILGLAGGSVTQELPIDGMDVWPVISRGCSSPRREILVNAEPKSGSMIVGDYKLVLKGTPDAVRMQLAGIAGGDFGYLYNIKTDPYETIDLFEKMPEKVEAILSRYEVYWKAAKTPLYEDNPSEDFKVPEVW
jgi:arylsulfatase A-like enzyme